MTDTTPNTTPLQELADIETAVSTLANMQLVDPALKDIAFRGIIARLRWVRATLVAHGEGHTNDG